MTDSPVFFGRTLSDAGSSLRLKCGLRADIKPHEIDSAFVHHPKQNWHRKKYGCLGGL